MRYLSPLPQVPRIASFTFLLCAFLAVFAADARIVRRWPDEELTAKSEFIAVAIPKKTSETDERGGLAGFESQPVLGVNTEFTVVAVYKGHQAMKSFVLHHYRFAGTTSVNGPTFLTFDTSGKQKYRLYLVKEPDGRYAPVAGQIDPDMSVRQELEK